MVKGASFSSAIEPFCLLRKQVGDEPYYGQFPPNTLDSVRRLECFELPNAVVTLQEVGTLSNLKTLTIAAYQHGQDICLCALRGLNIPQLSHLRLVGGLFDSFHCVGGAKRLTLEDGHYDIVVDFQESTSNLLEHVRGVVVLHVESFGISGPAWADPPFYLPKGLEELLLGVMDSFTLELFLRSACSICPTLKALSFSLYHIDVISLKVRISGDSPVVLN